jgi:hypothetical protein
LNTTIARVVHVFMSNLCLYGKRSRLHRGIFLPCHKKWSHMIWKYLKNIWWCGMKYVSKIPSCSFELIHLFIHSPLVAHPLVPLSKSVIVMFWCWGMGVCMQCDSSFFKPFFIVFFKYLNRFYGLMWPTLTTRANQRKHSFKKIPLYLLQ